MEENGSRKRVTLASLHLPLHAESLEEEGLKAEEGKVYEYWEREATSHRYKKTQWKYIVSDVPKVADYHKHELDMSQDSYNNGVGTATTWYQLKGTAGFDTNVANSIKTGVGNAGGIDSWAWAMMCFRPVKNTAESELLKADPKNQNIEPNGRISKDRLLYRTTIQQYGQESLNTPSDEILNDYIYMELLPYIDPATGVQAIDGRGEPVFTWNKFYYTDKEEVALNKIAAFDYGYEIDDEAMYTYSVATPQYQTRDELPYYQKLAPVYAYTDDLYSYEMAKHSYLPTKYAYREDSLSWETYDLEVYQPSYQEKIYTPWYTYDLPEIRKYSWQVMMSGPDTGKAPSLPTTGGDAPKQQLPKTGSSDNANLSLLGATGLAAWFIAWRKLKKAKK
ncbi:LPXTG cell wall anchor domain-containing protein [Pseudolactococcus reticulitermitis]